VVGKVEADGRGHQQAQDGAQQALTQFFEVLEE
jgi:hypothetical protein